VAGEQTRGHGRRGRPWQTRRGNLAATILLILPEGRANPATLGFVAGLALASAIRAAAPERDIPALRLKWPNDVLLEGAKVAGILLEATNVASGSGVAIGFGVNVLTHPQDLHYRATSLAACGFEVTVAGLFRALSEAWVVEQSRWDMGRGFADVRERWLRRAAGLGAPISVDTGAGLCDGTFETIDGDGRLIVRRADGEEFRVSAGEVHFGGAMSQGA
jgi:BirA family biotin operon repressor/biotin-[acetyl-CoA-carboxylase] ligase